MRKLWSFGQFFIFASLLGFRLGTKGVATTHSPCTHQRSQALQAFEGRGKRQQPLTLNEAMRRTLLQQPAIKIALYSIDIQQGIAKSSAGPFDPVAKAQLLHIYSRDLLNLNQNLNGLISVCLPATHTDLQAHETIVHGEISKTTREGTSIVFSLDIDQYHNPIACPNRLNVGKSTIEVTQPLLRGYREGLDYMTELANHQEGDAIRYDALQTISEQLQNTIFLYWDTLAGKKILEAQQQSETRLEEIVHNTKFLIGRGEAAPADLMQPLAQLSSQVVWHLLRLPILFFFAAL